ncbi:MAG: hypothetical protein M1823_003284 [Watsoniomyces obsoletus]|nr:MAG: hypothetical protein M1823_003284 [Watsoniomyces obsoletus]
MRGSIFRPVPLIALLSVVCSGQVNDTARPLIGCPALNCPTGQFNQPECILGNTTSTQVGVAQVDINITQQQQPLTWTVGVQEIENPLDFNRPLMERNFFLGAPPSLERPNASTTLIGCALFFPNFGILSESELDSTRSNCSESISEECRIDLISRVEAKFPSSAIPITRINRNLSSTCAELEVLMRQRIPQSCMLNPTHDWRSVIVRDITGSNAAPKLSRSTCHPTPRTEYDLSLVASYRTRFHKQLEIVEQRTLRYGFTPILTVFYSRTRGLAGRWNNQTEAHLTCVKPVVPPRMPATPRPQSRSRALRADALLAAVVAAAFASIFC